MALDMMVVGSKVKAYVKGKDLRVAGEMLDELNKHVSQMLDRAADRAKGNGRSTIKATDL